VNWRLLKLLPVGIAAMLLGGAVTAEVKPPLPAAARPAGVEPVAPPTAAATEWTRPAYQPAEVLAKKPAPAGPWCFVAFGDPHITAAVAPKPAKWNMILKRVDEQRPDLVLLLGDIASDGAIASWETVFKLSEPAFAKTPWFFAIGNHDFPQKDAGFPLIYDKIFKGPGTSATRAYYAFDRGNVRFVNLDCASVGDYSKGMSKGVEEWVAQQFASFKGDHLVMFNHFPPYTPTKYRYAVKLREYEKKFYEKYQGKSSITLVSAHVHHYYRTVRGGANYFAASAGYGGNFGMGRMVPKEKQELLPDDVVKGEEGVLKFTVDGKTIRFEYVGLTDGKVLDTYAITAKGK